jgi:GYF domain 2
MKKYFLKNDAGDQEGPFSPEELLAKGVGPDTSVWYEGLENWTTVSQVEELQTAFSNLSVSGAATEAVVPDILPLEEPVVIPAEPVVEPVVEPVAATPAPEPVAPVVAAAAPVAAIPAKPARTKGNPVITWALSLLVLGGTGYYVYQDMEKNKDIKNVSGTEIETTTYTTNVTTNDPAISTDTKQDQEVISETTDTVITSDSKDPVEGTEKPADVAVKKEEIKKPVVPVADKKEEEKKKKLAAEAKKKEEEKKKLLAAQALAAKEMEMRNGWVRYVTIGSFTTEGDDKVKPFTIPVYNGFNVAVDKVTLRVDYLKKEKIVASETLVLGTIPAKSGSNIQASGNKKGKSANVYIIGASSRALHFCYPSTGGKAGDQYYCN